MKVNIINKHTMLHTTFGHTIAKHLIQWMDSMIFSYPLDILSHLHADLYMTPNDFDMSRSTLSTGPGALRIYSQRDLPIKTGIVECACGQSLSISLSQTFSVTPFITPEQPKPLDLVQNFLRTSGDLLGGRSRQSRGGALHVHSRLTSKTNVARPLTRFSTSRTRNNS